MIVEPHLPDLMAFPDVDRVPDFLLELTDFPGNGQNVIQVDDHPA